jgi:hypothetical protein
MADICEECGENPVDFVWECRETGASGGCCFPCRNADRACMAEAEADANVAWAESMVAVFGDEPIACQEQ